MQPLCNKCYDSVVFTVNTNVGEQDKKGIGVIGQGINLGIPLTSQLLYTL
jgi:hypothetical protein